MQISYYPKNFIIKLAELSDLEANFHPEKILQDKCSSLEI